MIPRHRPLLRPEDVLASYGPRFGEYPVSLLTRRSYSQQTDAVINCREAAPSSIWLELRTCPEPWAFREEAR